MRGGALRELVPTEHELSDLGASADAGLDEQVEHELRRLRGSVRHGSITLVIQDGRVVQIDATHKLRLERRGGRGHSA
jgi:hypothetical protein